MQEDCLYLSVFTPQPNRTDLPVMVWLPQGGFISDATPLFQPEFLLAKDVVLVVLQHRLGVLGFLSTEDAELPGNLGLKDQAMALRWVQDNIRDLGGDPDKVTIFGQTRGARLCTTTCCLPCPVASSSEPSCSRGRRCVPGRSGRTTGRWPRLRPHGGLSGDAGRRQQHGARRLPQGRPRRAADGRDAVHHASPYVLTPARGRRIPPPTPPR
nr:carboxylesterase 4A-like [Penaeus vannamei]